MSAPGLPSSEAADRMNSIMKVDTNALLNTLKDLENKLSEYYKADEIPAWAGSILPRVEILELKTAKIDKKQNSTIPPNSTPATVQEIQMESRIFDRIKAEMDGAVETTKLSLEAKVTSISLELDRLNKLLQIRPTTSELQKVVLALQDIKRQVQGIFYIYIYAFYL